VLKKFLSSILVITLCLILLPTSVLAEEETVESYEPMRISSGISSRWWPGNPNPPYGSEDWLFQNYGYNFGSSAPSDIAKGCALQALIGGGISGAETLAYTWSTGGVFTLGVFVFKFGAGAATGYAGCLIYNGISS